MAEEKPKGWFDEDVVVQYLQENWNDKSLYSKIDLQYFRPETVKPHDLTVRDNQGSYSPRSLGQCLYMDVGCWTGNGPKSKANHLRHREFGIVCGNIAVLCDYPGKEGVDFIKDKNYHKVYKDGDNLKKLLGKAYPLYSEKIAPFLKFISSDPTLSKVGVLDATAILDRTFIDGREPDKETLQVFLGDLHLPVITDPESNQIPVDAPWGKDEGQDVLRAGRLRLNAEVIEQMSKIVAQINSVIAKTVEFKNIGGRLAVASLLGTAGIVTASVEIGQELSEHYHDILKQKEILKSMLTKLWMMQLIEDDFPSSVRTMSKADAAKWFNFYYGSDGEKGADIFQSAGKDLLTFLGLIKKYQNAHPNNKLSLAQLGDSCDCWIGMQSGMLDSPFSSLGDGVKLQKDGPAFAKYWHDMTKKSKVSGPVLNALENLAQKPPKNMTTTLLYGNHDNYLKHTHGRKACYTSKDGAVFAEHGHQSDSFNNDSEPTSGWALTQTAYVIPEVREIEDPLAVAMTLGGRFVSNNPGARLQRIARGADVCVGTNRLIYVTAHTHEPMLKKITVRPLLNPMNFIENAVGKDWTTAKSISARLARLNALLDVELGDGVTEGSLARVLEQVNTALDHSAHIFAGLSKDQKPSKQIEELDKHIKSAIELADSLSKDRKKNKQKELEELVEHARRQVTRKEQLDKLHNVIEKFRMLKFLIEGAVEKADYGQALQSIENICATVDDEKEGQALYDALVPIAKGVVNDDYSNKALVKLSRLPHTRSYN